MPDVKLGPAGTETTLPALNWLAGDSPELPVGYKKNYDKATMLDGSVRVNVKTYHQKSFALEWAQLTEAQLEVLIGLSEYNEALRFQNNWIDATWRWVMVASLDWSPLQQTWVATPYFRASMTLEEVEG